MEHEGNINCYIRKIYKTPEFEEFFNGLNNKTQIKFEYVIDIVTTVYNVSTKFVKKLESTDLYELRVSLGSNEFRTILFAIDNDNFIEAKNIILLNGFKKKSTKDYKKEIKKAEAMLKQLELWNEH